jgi:arsenate reductase
MKIYQYEKCESCRKAVRWLNEREIKFTSFPIRDKTPNKKEIQQMIKAHGGELKKLFNTSSKDYRDPKVKVKDKIPSMTEEEIISLLQERGNLIKRPFVVGEGIALQGFKPEIWAKVFGLSD